MVKPVVNTNLFFFLRSGNASLCESWVCIVSCQRCLQTLIAGAGSRSPLQRLRGTVGIAALLQVVHKNGNLHQRGNIRSYSLYRCYADGVMNV